MVSDAMFQLRSLIMFRRIALIWLVVIAAIVPAVASSDGPLSQPSFPQDGVYDATDVALNPAFAQLHVSDHLLEQHPKIWIFDRLGSFEESSDHQGNVGLNSWSPTSGDDAEEVPSVEPFHFPVSLIADSLPLPLSSSFELRGAASRHPFQGFEDASHLRGPPSPSFN